MFIISPLSKLIITYLTSLNWQPTHFITISITTSLFHTISFISFTSNAMPLTRYEEMLLGSMYHSKYYCTHSVYADVHSLYLPQGEWPWEKSVHLFLYVLPIFIHLCCPILRSRLTLPFFSLLIYFCNSMRFCRIIIPMSIEWKVVYELVNTVGSRMVRTTWLYFWTRLKRKHLWF